MSANRYQDPPRRRRSNKERKKRLLIRRTLVVLAGVLLVAAVAGVIYGVTRLAGGEKPGTTASSSSAASAPASSQAMPAKPDETAKGEPLEVKKDGLTGYEALYPDMYVQTKPGKWKDPVTKTVYLTFDDGPSKLTQPLLEELKKYNVKATFFLTNQPNQKDYIGEIRKIYEAGHVCAVHSATHDYPTIYRSVEAYLKDFYDMWKIIQEQTDGHCAPFFRFPGGSNNPQGGSEEVRADIQKEMLRRGFFYYDWDIDSRDAEGARAAAIYTNVTGGMSRDGNMPLMHNIAGKEATLQQVPKIIEYGQQNGYTFLPMDGTLDPSTFLLGGVGKDAFFSVVGNSPNFEVSDAHKKQFAEKLGLASSPSSQENGDGGQE